MKMKKFSKRATRKNMLKIIAMAILYIAAMACDQNNDPDGGFGFSHFSPQTPQGNNIELTYPDGKTKSLGGESVFGWAKGSLLGGEKFWRQVRGGGNNGVFWVRFNLPENTEKEDVVGKEHSLSPVRFKLENSGQLNDIHPEIWFSGGNFNNQKNAKGTVKIIETDTYEIIGYMKGEVVDNDNKLVKFEGYFWKRDAEDWYIN